MYQLPAIRFFGGGTCLEIMQLPTTLSPVRTAGVELANAAPGRIAPAAATHSPGSADIPPEQGVVDDINTARYNNPSVTYPRPHERTAPPPHGVQSSRDWATRKDATDPAAMPELPVAEVLVEHLRIVWMASAGAVQTPGQIDPSLLEQQNQVPPNDYSIHKVNKIDQV